MIKMRSTTLLSLLAGAGSSIGAQLQQPIAGVPQRPLDLDRAAAAAPPYRNALLGLHRELIEVSSVSGTENAVGTFMVDYLTARGYVAQLDPVPPIDNTPPGHLRFNVLAWPGSAGSAARAPSPRLLISSHIDTVPPFIPYAMDRQGGSIDADTVIRGRGSVDAKASVAAQVVAVEELLAAGQVDPADVMLLFVVGEEINGDGMKHFNQTLAALEPPLRFEAAIFGEPTEGKLACGHKGMLGCTATAKGRAGHSGYPWLGKSATELMIRGLARVFDTDLGSSERFGNTTVNIGLISGGVAANVIPENASAKVAARVATGPEVDGHAEVASRIAKIFADVDPDGDLTLECTAGYGAVACECEVEGTFPALLPLSPLS